MAGNTQKRGKWVMHSVGPGICQENWKSWKMRNTHGRKWNMASNIEKHEKLEMHTVGPRVWQENWKSCKI